MMNKLVFINLIKFLTGISIIIYVFYVRILLVRAPKELNILFPSVNYKLIIIVFLGIFISIFICYKSIIIIKNKKITETKLQALIMKFNEFIESSLKVVTNFILNYISENYDIISMFSKNFYYIFGKKHEGFFILVAYITRIFILSFFLIDIFYFFKLNYFYKSLILLCIPLTINILFFFLKEFSKNLDDIKQGLIIIEDGLNITGLPITKFRLSPNNKDADLSYQVSEYLICNKINGYLEGYDFYSSYYGPRFNLLIYSFYLVGWIFIIIKNVSFFV